MISLFMIALLAPLGEAPSVEFQPDQPIYWSSERWNVFGYPDEGVCDIGHAASEDSYLSLQYDARAQIAKLMVTNKFAKSMADGDTVLLNIVLFQNKSIAKTWDNTHFTVRVLEDGSRALISSELPRQFLTAFSESELLGVVTPRNAVVGGANLTGSAKAIEMLEKCSFEAAELDPRDPFIQ